MAEYVQSLWPIRLTIRESWRVLNSLPLADFSITYDGRVESKSNLKDKALTQL